MRSDLRDALQDRALEVELQHHAERRARVPGSWPTGKFRARTWPVSSSSSSGGSGRGSPGFGGVGVRASRRAERAVDGRVLVEERQEHDDAFGDR